MSQLLENTYNAFEQFVEGEINQYDLMSLIEEGIISGEVLESMLVESGLVDVEEDEELEEGFIGDMKGLYYMSKAKKGLGNAQLIAKGGYPKLNDLSSITDGVYKNLKNDRNSVASTLKNLRKSIRSFGGEAEEPGEVNKRIKELMPDYKSKLGRNHRELLSLKK